LSLNLIMLGPPGAGKGTQAERFAASRGIPKISTGDMLRQAVQDGTAIGQLAKATIARGELVSDDVMIGIVHDRLALDDARTGFVLDGFPRTVTQATALDGMMGRRGALIVIEIVVDEVELVRRLSVRMVCDVCGATAHGFAGANGVTAARPVACRLCGGKLVQRNDDDDAVVRDRLAIYRRQTKPLVDYYQERPTFRSVDGLQPPDRVAADLAAAIEAAGSSAVGSSAVGNSAVGNSAVGNIVSKPGERAS
jgi:adenylate kinase